MPVEHTNWRGDTYYLHEGVTNKGNPRYFFSRNPKGKLSERIPDGYEVYEMPNGRPYARKVLIPLISEIEIRIIANSIPKAVHNKLVVKKRSVTVYIAEEMSPSSNFLGKQVLGEYQPLLRFVLTNDKCRTFDVEFLIRFDEIADEDEEVYEDQWICEDTSNDLRSLAARYCGRLPSDFLYDFDDDEID